MSILKRILWNEKRLQHKMLDKIFSVRGILKKCACCGKEFDSYLPLPEYYFDMAEKYNINTDEVYEMLNFFEYTCPYCESADRERAYALVMRQLFDPQSKFSVLEIAPRKCITDFIKNNFPLAEYKSGDLFMPDVDYKLDITDMNQLPDGSFDFFICSHVLEHVSDDIKAMRELRRILTPKGCGIAVVPIDLTRKEIDEDPNCTDVEERWRRFGQDDHVRAYSRDGFIQRLRQANFNVTEYDKKFFSKKLRRENGLTDTAVVYVVSPA